MSRKQKIWVSVVFLLVLLVSVVTNMPARQLYRVVQIPPSLKVYGLSGTVAHARVEQLSVQKFSLSDVRLDWQPLCLLKAAVCYHIYSDDKELQGILQLALMSGEMTLEQGRIVLDSQLLQQFTTLLVKPKGRFDIELETLSMKDRKLLNLNAKINWLNAGIEGEEQLLGNYQALAVMTDEGFNIDLSDKDSLLKLQGEILLQWSGEYSADVKLEARPGLKPSIKSALELFAQRSGLDRYSIRKKARLNASQREWLSAIH
jgi:hypothetical protein